MKKNKKQKNSHKLFWIFAIIIVIWIVAGVSISGDKLDSKDETKLSSTLEKEKNSEESSSKQEEKSSSSGSNSSKFSSSQEDSNVSKEFVAALKSAKTYSKVMHMSKQGIYDQLISEYGDKFPPEAAQYAVDNLKADYNSNALENAKSYSEMNMSKQGIYDQLTSENGEKFTSDEASYAVDNLKTDYKANALKKAKSYQKDMNMSNEDIREQLISEYGEKFTPEEANYAVDNMDK